MSFTTSWCCEMPASDCSALLARARNRPSLRRTTGSPRSSRPVGEPPGTPPIPRFSPPIRLPPETPVDPRRPFGKTVPPSPRKGHSKARPERPDRKSGFTFDLRPRWVRPPLHHLRTLLKGAGAFPSPSHRNGGERTFHSPCYATSSNLFEDGTHFREPRLRTDFASRPSRAFTSDYFKDKRTRQTCPRSRNANIPPPDTAPHPSIRTNHRTRADH